MVILLSGRKSAVEKEIINILTKYNATYISDKMVTAGKGSMTIVSEYKKTQIDVKKGVAVIIDDTDRFIGQTFQKGIIGICEEENLKALQIFSNSDIPVICCGMGAKNTITLSSLNSDTLLASLQRTITDHFGNKLYPSEFKIKLTKKYSPFSVMASTAILLLNGIMPDKY